MNSQQIKNRVSPSCVKFFLCIAVFLGASFSNLGSKLLYLPHFGGRAYAQSPKSGAGGGVPPAGGVKQPSSGVSNITSSPGQSGGDSSLPPIHRTVIHTEAYKKREGFGPHINFKITPPEKRGRKGRVLVEVYNYSKVNLAVVNFWLILSNQWGDRIEVQINCDEIPAGWSALKWVKIPGDKTIPEITSVQIKNMKIFDDRGRETKLKYFTDLIKQ
jgi:hypothetical protein